MGKRAASPVFVAGRLGVRDHSEQELPSCVTAWRCRQLPTPTANEPPLAGVLKVIDVKRQQGKRQKQAGKKGGKHGKGGAAPAFGGLGAGQPAVTGAAALKSLLGAAPASRGGLQPFGTGVVPFGFGSGAVGAGAGLPAWD